MWWTNVSRSADEESGECIQLRRLSIIKMAFACHKSDKRPIMHWKTARKTSTTSDEETAIINFLVSVTLCSISDGHSMSICKSLFFVLLRQCKFVRWSFDHFAPLTHWRRALYVHYLAASKTYTYVNRKIKSIDLSGFNKISKRKKITYINRSVFTNLFGLVNSHIWEIELKKSLAKVVDLWVRLQAAFDGFTTSVLCWTHDTCRHNSEW